MGAWVDPRTGRTFAAPGGSEGVADDWIEARGFRVLRAIRPGGNYSLIEHGMVALDLARRELQTRWAIMIAAALQREESARAARA